VCGCDDAALVTEPCWRCPMRNGSSHVCSASNWRGAAALSHCNQRCCLLPAHRSERRQLSNLDTDAGGDTVGKVMKRVALTPISRDYWCIGSRKCIDLQICRQMGAVASATSSEQALFCYRCQQTKYTPRLPRTDGSGPTYICPTCSSDFVQVKSTGYVLVVFVWPHSVRSAR
jgi:hypothetical protein